MLTSIVFVEKEDDEEEAQKKGWKGRKFFCFLGGELAAVLVFGGGAKGMEKNWKGERWGKRKVTFFSL